MAVKNLLDHLLTHRSMLAGQLLAGLPFALPSLLG
jgi:hypothetical protein